MVVAQLVSHYETLHNDHNTSPLPLDTSRQNITVQFHSAPLQELKTRKSLPNLNDMDDKPNDLAASNNFNHRSVGLTSEPLPLLHIETENLDTETETRKRSSSSSTASRPDTKDLISNSSSTSLPCLSRSSSVTSASGPSTPKREVPTFLFTSDESLSSSEPSDEAESPTLAIVKTSFSKSRRDKGKGKAVDRSLSEYQNAALRQSTTLDSMQFDYAALAAQAHADFRYSLAGRQFQSQLNLSYMPTIHENFQSLPFLDQDPCAKLERRSRPRSVAPEHFHRGASSLLQPVNTATRLHAPIPRPESIKSTSTTDTNQSKGSVSSLKKMPSSMLRGLKRYYFGDPNV